MVMNSAPGFWCWSKKDASTIFDWGSSYAQPIKTFVGVLWQRLWQSKIAVRNFINRNENQLLNTWSKNNFHNADWRHFWKLEELLEMSLPEWNWWIRCHPMRNSKMNIK